MNAHAPYLIQDGHDAHSPARPSGGRVMRLSVLRCLCALVCLLTTVAHPTVSVAKPKAKRVKAPPVEFTLISLERPLLRRGKRLTTPRRVVLFASREPLPYELEEELGSRQWVGRELHIFRASPIKVNPQEVAEQEARLIERYQLLTRGHVKSHHQSIRDEASRFVQQRVKPVARGEATQRLQPSDPMLNLSAPKSEGGEREDDDDELSAPSPVDPSPTQGQEVSADSLSTAEGQLCGGEGQPCCEQGFDDPCDGALTCLVDQETAGESEERWRCQPAPDPCGGYAEPCCMETELPCLFEGLVCSGGEGATGMCVMPPLPAPERRVLVGSLKVLNVRGRFVEAEVTADRLVGVGIHAVMKGDKALFKGGR